MLRSGAVRTTCSASNPESTLILQRFLALASILTMTLACRTAFGSPAGSPPATGATGLLPPATTSLELEVVDSANPSLSEVLVQLSASTGVHFTASEDVQQGLQRSHCGLLGSVSVPADRAWLWTESLLEHEGFQLGILSADAPCLVAVYPLLPTPGRPGVRANTPVDESRLELLAEHPVLLVSTTLELPHTDVRQLGNSLRGLTTDPTGQQNVVPVGNTNSVILTGTGRQVRQLATLLREIDAKEAAAIERRAQLQGSGDAAQQGDGR